MSSEAQGIVESCQPFVYGYYANANESFLWLLHELSNADKHRLLNVATTYDIQGQAMLQWDPPISGIEWIVSPSKGALEHGAEFFRIRVTGATTETKLNVNSHYGFSLLFNESVAAAANLPVTEVLNGAGRFVAGIINAFARL